MIHDKDTSDFEGSPPPNRVLLSDTEVAARYGVSVYTLRWWRQLTDRGEGQHGPRFVRLGRLVRYRVSDVEDWITGAQNTQERESARKAQERQRFLQAVQRGVTHPRAVNASRVNGRSAR